MAFSSAIFEAFDRHRVPVDVVSTSEVSVSLTVDSNESIPPLAADLAKLADVKYEGRKAIVCLVGENLRETPGIAARVFGELADVKIRMISQGASEINLTFVIEEDDVSRRGSAAAQDVFFGSGSGSVCVKVQHPKTPSYAENCSRRALRKSSNAYLCSRDAARPARWSRRSRLTQRGHRVRVLWRGGKPTCLRAYGRESATVSMWSLISRLRRRFWKTLRLAWRAGKNMVVGTTGWYGDPEGATLVEQKGTGFLYGANFSVGVNLFFEVARTAAAALQHQYFGQIFERHHAQKKDAPSGTAVALQKIIRGSLRARNWKSPRSARAMWSACTSSTLDSPNDTIYLCHDAKSRRGFAEGAVRAAEWLAGKKGFFDFKDSLERDCSSSRVSSSRRGEHPPPTSVRARLLAVSLLAPISVIFYLYATPWLRYGA